MTDKLLCCVKVETIVDVINYDRENSMYTKAITQVVGQGN
jgi:hypothetical protein